MTQTFRMRRQVEFNHCDAAGIVFYPRYFEMISATVERFFSDAIDSSWSRGLQSGTGTPLGQIEVRFLAPSRLEDWLDFELTILRVGTSSLTLKLDCFSGAEHRFACEATVVHVDFASGGALPWSDAFRERIAPFVSFSDISN